VADRLRSLLDLVLGSLDEPGADGRQLAERAHFSRDHLDRLLAGATGERPVALRRRLLLERAAWQLRTGAVSPSEAAAAAGYGSLAAFSRAFARAHGIPPSAFGGSGRPHELEAPNGIHFHPPAGCSCPAPRRPRAGATSPTGSSATTSTGSASCSRVRRAAAADLERAIRPGSWSCGSRARRPARE
jgi:AraC-like DNA-binding protein